MVKPVQDVPGSKNVLVCLGVSLLEERKRGENEGVDERGCGCVRVLVGLA